MKKIYVIAGEASGDLHGANLIRHLRERAPVPLDIYGVGGDRIKESGAKNFFDIAHWGVTGITDAIKRYPQYKKAAVTILVQIAETRPDVVVFIDNPGFNLHLAAHIHKLGIPVVYYIAPQVWAWAPKRIKKIKKYVRKVLVVFEFEKAFYEKHGVSVAWVGHPLKDMIASEAALAVEHAPVKDRRAGGPVIALLPGSRKGELKMLFSVLVKTAARIRQTLPNAVFDLIKAPTLPATYYERLLSEDTTGSIRLVTERSYAAIRASDLAIVCSGTATLECALLGTPMIITNKGTMITYFAAKNLIRVPFLGLPNLILGEGKIPELLQFDATPEKLAAASLKLLTDAAARKTMQEDLKRVSAKLGEIGATRRAAEEVLKLL